MEHPFAAHVRTYRPRELPVGTLKPSAVLLLLEGGANDGQSGREECIVFQLRTHNVRFHKGEISLPGGRLDPEDPSFLHAALRETHEEIGVPPEAVTVLGALDDVEARRSGYLIRPFVGVLAPGVEPAITAPREVATLLHVPLAHLRDPAQRVWHAAELDGAIQTSLAYGFGEHVIWGVTGRILDQFFGLLGDTMAGEAAARAAAAEDAVEA